VKPVNKRLPAAQQPRHKMGRSNSKRRYRGCPAGDPQPVAVPSTRPPAAPARPPSGPPPAGAGPARRRQGRERC